MPALQQGCWGPDPTEKVIFSLIQSNPTQLGGSCETGNLMRGQSDAQLDGQAVLEQLTCEPMSLALQCCQCIRLIALHSKGSVSQYLLYLQNASAAFEILGLTLFIDLQPQ